MKSSRIHLVIVAIIIVLALILPHLANAQTIVLITPVGEIDQLTPAFQWGAVPTVSSYHVYLLDKTGITISVVDVETTSCSLGLCSANPFTLEENREYRWMVRADDIWSEAAAFSTRMISTLTPSPTYTESPTSTLGAVVYSTLSVAGGRESQFSYSADAGQAFMSSLLLFIIVLLLFGLALITRRFS